MPPIVYPGVYVEEARAGTPIEGVPTATAAFVGASLGGPVGTPTAIGSYADFERVFGGLAPGHALGYAVWQFFDNGGSGARIVRTAGASVEAALAALEPETFNLLCVPPPRDGEDLSPAARAAAAALCRRRRALFVVDPSHAWRTAADAVNGLDTFFPQRGAESALYFPYVRMSDPLAGGQLREVAPCGAIAGVMARTDRNRGVWKAPAGLEAGLRGAVAPALALTDGDNQVLNPLGINAVRQFPRAGVVPWGARTLARRDGGEEEFSYVPVRRFAAFIEDSVRRGLRGVVFEPNAEPTWKRVREAVGRFLHDLFRQGAMAGQASREAFFVRCDASTTTAADIAAGRANLLVGFAPLKPAEFVTLPIDLAMTVPDP